MDESISILDPRRFTPTLHANLVSEILALRRDQEEKLKIIESLETSLHTTRQEHESLQSNLANTTKEGRSLKRQLALLEGGTSSALGELARERDEAVDSITETKRRLEVAQKKVRTQEEDSQRVHDLWAKDKDDWNEERRKYERKLHVAESRLRVVLEEVANLQASQVNGINNGPESDGEEGGKENDGASVRTMSLTNSNRFSMMSGPGMGKINGHCLADELNFDDTDYETDPDGRQSIISPPRHKRNQSRDSMMSRSHRRNQSNDGPARPGSIIRSRMFMNQTVLDRLEGGIREDDEYPVASEKVQYTDTGVQFTPPSSPKLPPAKPSTPEPVSRSEKSMGLESPRTEGEIEANQSRKRVQLNRPVPIEPQKPAKPMVSAASQTLENVPLLVTSAPIIMETKPPVAIVSRSIAIQTDPTPTARQLTPEPRAIPSISIIPPTSRPSTPREHRLPQYVKDFGCQVSLLEWKPTNEASVQTDEIRIDKRLDRLPRHLHPSAISSRPSSPTAASSLDENKIFTPVPGHVPPRNPRRLEGRRSFSADLPSSPPDSPTATDGLGTRDAYPGNNDDGPLSNTKAPARRPHRISSLFAGFDAQSSDEVDEFDGDQSDSEYRTALAPRPKTGPGKSVKRVSASAVPVPHLTAPEQTKATRHSTSAMSRAGGPEVHSSYRLADAPEGLAKPSLKLATRTSDRTAAYSTGSRASVMRKSAMIQSGIASHQGRPRSPSIPETRDPPFPIPTRASSRKPPFSISAPSDGQRSPTRNGEASNRRGMRSSTYRTSSIRKIRSAVVLPRNQRHRRQSSRSPPPLSPSEEGPESPRLPPLPSNDITTPRRDYGRNRGHMSQPSTNTANTENTNMGSVGSNQQTSTVVDAIAQTMVGEWMFKYVRRRKSFGVADGGGRGEENSNDRHKRWVWLAPYERAIMWSSKQPASGNALMGKPGRKCKRSRKPPTRNKRH